MNFMNELNETITNVIQNQRSKEKIFNKSRAKRVYTRFPEVLVIESHLIIIVHHNLCFFQ